MDSDLHQQTLTSGLTRYRSAPSSYSSNVITNLFKDDDTDPFFNNKVSNAEIDQILSRFTSSIDAGAGSDSNMNQIGEFEPQFMTSVKQEQDGFYSESPAFIPQNIDHGYSLMRSMDDYRGGRGNVPNSMTSAKRMKNEIGYSSGSQLSSGMLPRIPENEAKVMEMKSTRNDPGFGSNSWDDSDILSDSFLKEYGESDQNKLSSLNASSNQSNDAGRNRPPTKLVHHMSLPANTAELDKLMQFQDLVPLKSRAKRGCATHPRSIAERVRRTKISERMRKLQDLVPNMDKQTNTADMLDLAVDYIKELKKEAETLSEHYAKCSCPHKQNLQNRLP